MSDKIPEQHHEHPIIAENWAEVAAPNRMLSRIALVNWTEPDENAVAIRKELIALGHETIFFRFDQAIPSGVDVVFTFAPYDRLFPIVRQLRESKQENRPQWIHWNFESLPSITFPWFLSSSVGALRSWLDRQIDSDNRWLRMIASIPPISWANRKWHKARYLGEYQYAHCQAWLTILCDASQIFAEKSTRHNLPTKYVPWGSSPDWYADLAMERDIDVLWMGKWRTRQRAKRLFELRTDLAKRGLTMYMADNVEHPFGYGSDRTKLLNRAKITVNILPSWYDPGFQFRFGKAAANRSLVVSTPTLPHVPICRAGTHYVSTPVESIADAIQYYIEHGDERQRIVDSAYHLATRELSLANSVKTIMDAIGEQA